ncbi:MAG: hypothetical protein BGO67_03625 [Alphaproteobacteria bacterium 41-28]|nr:MAG: hypothetical protein BGO67_03625 [Alphaproteobacteria bacterium 41-28]
MPFRAFPFFIFSVLGPFVLVNLALFQHTNTSGEVEWYPTSSLSRDLVLLAFVVYGMDLCRQIALHVYTANGTDIDWPVFFSVIAIKFWVIKIFICGIFAQWILIKLKCNLRSSISSEKKITAQSNENQKEFFDFVKSKSTESIENPSLNTLYYMNFFNKYKFKGSIYKTMTFCLPAFLFSSYWFFYRKMYLYGILLTTFYALLGFLVYFIPFSSIMLSYLVSATTIGFISAPLYIKFSEKKTRKGNKESGVSPLSVLVVFFILTIIGLSIGRASFSTLSLFPDLDYWKYYLYAGYKKIINRLILLF